MAAEWSQENYLPKHPFVLYYQLAEGKAKQQQAWVKMRKEFSEKTGEFGTIDPDNYVLSHPEVMAGLTWLGTGNGIRKKIRGTESKEEILKDAINRENAVITFPAACSPS